ncbi:hypothetical protein ABLE68_12915 [Nocardioides sp. CN2-186]|uniref:hypothetical protein n=1 Tax=Nocardioides tweenelious TaxID=3156607 RepID=UPI0032B5667D
MPSTWRVGGLAAAVGAAALVLPLLAVNPAQASIPKADLTIVKTVASHGPTIDLDPRLSDTLDRGNVAWEQTGAHLTTTPPYADLAQCGQSQAATQYCISEFPKMQIGEYVDTSTRLEDVIASATPPQNGPQNPFALPRLNVAAPPGGVGSGPVNMVYIVDLGKAPAFPTADFGSIKLVLPVGQGTLDTPWVGMTLANGTLPAGPWPASNGGPQGTAKLADWLTVFPDATVTAFGFATPPVPQFQAPTPTNLIITSIDFNGVHYDLSRTNVFKPSVSAEPGETVTYRIVVTNGSSVDTKTAGGVQVADALPAQFTYAAGTLSSPNWPCAFTGNVLSCSGITISAGSSRTITFDATLDDTLSTADLPASPGHAVGVQHRSTSVDLPSTQTKTITTMCPTGYLATDGGLLISSIGQGGDYSDVVISSSQPVTVSGVAGWRVQASNLGGGFAQGKATVTCLASTVGSSASHTHALLGTHPAMKRLIAVNDFGPISPRRVSRSCPTGYTPYAPAFDVSDGVAVMRESYAVDNTWYWTVDYSDDTNAWFGISCLAPQTTTTDGHQATLTVATPDDTISVAPETVADGPEPCPDNSNAIVGGYGSDDNDILPLGMDPLGDSYLLRFYNADWDSAHHADIQVTCISATTGDEPAYQHVVNTAYLTSTTKDRSYADNSSSADVAVTSNGNGTPTKPSGVTLSTLAAQRTTNSSNKATAIVLQMLCSTAPSCSFTVKGLVGSTVVATKTTSIPQNLITPKSVTVPTTGAGKGLAFGDNVTVQIKTSKGTTQYVVGIVS